jgi:ssDNA-binding Zn-finger/Zn-ribbon topoisomerase 1
MDSILNDFIILHLKCPLCEATLMDKTHLVDGQPGIKLLIETPRQKGTIFLSAVYESYNFKSDVDIFENEIVKFSCPQCLKEIRNCMTCELCEAPMIPFLLDFGGKVMICSRAGCKAHFLEFEDFKKALYKILHLGEYKDSIPEIIEKNGEAKEILESGTFLQTYCPHCEKSFIEKGVIKLIVVNDKNEEGFVFLSPYLNVYTSRSTVFLKEDYAVNDIKCWHCNKSLIDRKGRCLTCGSPRARIVISAETKLIDFYICSKKGCRWHGLDEKDLHDIHLEDSMEW